MMSHRLKKELFPIAELVLQKEKERLLIKY
jgi:hypothetical protein